MGVEIFTWQCEREGWKEPKSDIPEARDICKEVHKPT